MRPLRHGDTGPDVTSLQVALNQRSRARGLPTITVDGEYGPATDKAVQRVSRALGALEATIRKPGATIGEQRIIRWPASRTPAQLRRARDRKRAASAPLRERAYREAARLIGIMEQGGNNRGAQVEQIIREGGGRVGDPWCGWFCAAVYRRAGSKAVTWQWGAVRLYLPLPGLRRTTSPKRGDLVRFTFDHIGMFVADHGSEIETIEGNTGRTGAVSDSRTGGDGVYRKRRPKSLVRDYIRVER